MTRLVADRAPDQQQCRVATDLREESGRWTDADVEARIRRVELSPELREQRPTGIEAGSSRPCRVGEQQRQPEAGGERGAEGAISRTSATTRASTTIATGPD
jgi:hypothetical protein